MADETQQLAAQITVANYTSVAKIRKRIRSINDIAIPLKRGLGEDQLIAILGTLAALGIIYAIVLAPLISLTHFAATWPMFGVYLIAPCFLTAQKISKPMKSGKTISGTMTSWIRFKLDDPVHRRGVPQAKGAELGRRLHYQRSWVPKDLADEREPLALGRGDEDYHYEGVSFLDRWMAEHSVEHEEKREAEAEDQKVSKAAQQEALRTATPHTVRFDFED